MDKGKTQALFRYGIGSTVKLFLSFGLIFGFLRRKNVLEKEIEKRFVRRVEATKKCKCFKFVSPGNAGVPDRIVLQKGGHIYFVELKREGQKPRPLQVHVFKVIEKYDFPVYVVDSVEAIDKFVEMIRSKE